MNTPCSVCCSQSVSHPYSRWSISEQCSTMEVQEHKYTQTFKKCSHFFSFNEYQMLKSRIVGMRFNVENVSDHDFRDRDNIRLQREHASYRTKLLQLNALWNVLVRLFHLSTPSTFSSSYVLSSLSSPLLIFPELYWCTYIESDNKIICIKTWGKASILHKEGIYSSSKSH